MRLAWLHHTHNIYIHITSRLQNWLPSNKATCTPLFNSLYWFPQAKMNLDISCLPFHHIQWQHSEERKKSCFVVLHNGRKYRRYFDGLVQERCYSSALVFVALTHRFEIWISIHINKRLKKTLFALIISWAGIIKIPQKAIWNMKR